MPTLFITGERYSGISSFLNALCGNIITKTSILEDDIARKFKKYAFTNYDMDFVVYKHYTNEIQEVPDDLIINDKYFFDKLDEEIAECDLLVYVIDSHKGLATQSELNNLNKIKKVIEKENENGHYLNYIIVMNKYDMVEDETLDIIYDKTLLHFPKEQVFRCSSHKMLINSIVQNNSTLIVDTDTKNTMQTELLITLGNAEVIMSDQEKKDIYDSGMVSYTNIKFKEGDTTLVDTKQAQKVAGDWDGLINYIKNTKSFSINKIKPVLENKFMKLLATHNFVTVDLASHRYNDIYKDFCIKFNELIIAGEKYDLKYDFFEGIMQKYIDMLHESGRLKLNDFIKSIYPCHYATYPKLLRLMELNKDKLHHGALAGAIYLNRNSNKVIKLLLHILKNKNVWIHEKIIRSYYKISVDKYHKRYIKIEGTYSHDSWLINNLLNSENDIIKTLMIISTTPIYALKQLYKTGKLPILLLEKIHPDFTIQLKLCFELNILKDEECLEHRLFTSDIDPKITFYLNREKEFEQFSLHDEVCAQKIEKLLA